MAPRRPQPLAQLLAPKEEQGLAEFVEDWWRLYAVTQLEENTRRAYAITWDRHIRPFLGAHELHELTPLVIDHWKCRPRVSAPRRCARRWPCCKAS